MEVVFACKQADCNERVVYVPDSVMVIRSSPAMPEPHGDLGTAAVYLTCTNGHTFPYWMRDVSRDEPQ